MNPKLLKKLLLNALEIVAEEQSNAGCNDIFPDESFLKNVTKAEQKEIETTWATNNPEEFKNYGKMYFNNQITEVIKQELEKIEL